MALTGWAAFTAGVAVGWAGRSVLGSGRELLVRGVAVLYAARDEARRVAVEQVEWVEDAFAEGRARYDSHRDETTVDEGSPVRVGPRAVHEAA